MGGPLQQTRSGKLGSLQLLLSSSAVSAVVPPGISSSESGRTIRGVLGLEGSVTAPSSRLGQNLLLSLLAVASLTLPPLGIPLSAAYVLSRGSSWQELAIAFNESAKRNDSSIKGFFFKSTAFDATDTSWSGAI